MGVDDERDEIPTTGVEAVGRGEYLMQPREMDEAIATELGRQIDAGGTTRLPHLALGEMDEAGHRDVPAASDPFDERRPVGVGQEGSDCSPLTHRRKFDVGHPEQRAGEFELAA